MAKLRVGVQAGRCNLPIRSCYVAVAGDAVIVGERRVGALPVRAGTGIHRYPSVVRGRKNARVRGHGSDAVRFRAIRVRIEPEARAKIYRCARRGDPERQSVIQCGIHLDTAGIDAESRSGVVADGYVVASLRCRVYRRAGARLPRVDPASRLIDICPAHPAPVIERACALPAFESRVTE